MMHVTVPYDFTPVADYAVQYAELMLKDKPNSSVTLLHVVDKGTKAEEIQKRQERLQSVQVKAAAGQPLNVQYEVREGLIYNTITEFAEVSHTDLIIMGTHGIRGLQNFMGSKAIRVIMNSNVPFLVVQRAPRPDEQFKNVLMPLGALQVEVEKFNWAVQQAQLHGSRFFVLTETYNDSSLMAKCAGHVAIMRRVFETNGVPFEQEEAAKGKNFNEEMERYARKVKADMMLIMITQPSGALGSILNPRDQKIIDNSLEMPVLCVTPAMI